MTIDLGVMSHIVELIGFMGSAIWFVSRLNSQISVMLAQSHNDRELSTTRFKEIEDQLKELVKATVQLARQEERLDAMDARITDLLHRMEGIREKRSISINSASKRKRA